tara:strand:- start:66 stop:359 length:294 start_codon:yes stop_codon:yes gene_type:complete
MIHTSKAIEAMSIDDLESVIDGMLYRPTDAEVEALQWIGDRYHVSEHLLSYLDSDGVLTLSASCIGEALREDGVDRVPCLSDDSQLQRLVWLIGPSY